ncbi:MAG TPA: substrate-binding domain-containing protein [Polyangiaceae bacterium]|nr:substrate-binding domain-containing protein [Polyangiaceae bacterium]
MLADSTTFIHDKFTCLDVMQTRLMAIETPLQRVRAQREKRGLSQVELAHAVGLTRQSVHAIETGRAVPAVDVALRLARALDCEVEALFGGPSVEVELAAEPVGPSAPGRVALAHIAGRWLSYALDGDGIARSADAIAARGRSQRRVEPLRPPAETRENVVVVGCAPALGLLADRLNSRAGSGRFLWFARTSTEALEALRRKEAHIAGVHLVDTKSGEPNVPHVRRAMRGRAVSVVTLGRWQAGIVVAPGNPRGLSDVAGLAHKGVRLVPRQPGSGAQLLLERELERAGLPQRLARGTVPPAAGHLEVARAVAMGFVDAGIATNDAALAFGLAFVPLAEERYDLVVARDELDDRRVTRWFEALTAAPFRREAAALGYDVAQAGARVAELPAN